MDVSIPGYTIKRVLGKGGMATVYLAVHDIFEREVALKVMNARLAEDPSFGHRFIREAKIVSRLTHNNIISVYDVGVHGDLYYLCMEYVDGPDLKNAQDYLTLPQKINIIRELAAALAYAGAMGIVHRDIKAENILLRQPEQSPVLMDFGIARAAESELSVTQTGTSLGTPHYMSPEQARGEQVDHRSDLYSLGVVLYFVLLGEVPFKGDSAVSVGIKHITEPVPTLPSVLMSLQPIVNKLMAKKPDERFQRADDLIQALDALELPKEEQVKGALIRPVGQVKSPVEPLTTQIDSNYSPQITRGLKAHSGTLSNALRSRKALTISVAIILAVMGLTWFGLSSLRSIPEKGLVDAQMQAPVVAELSEPASESSLVPLEAGEGDTLKDESQKVEPQVAVTEDNEEVGGRIVEQTPQQSGEPQQADAWELLPVLRTRLSHSPKPPPTSLQRNLSRMVANIRREIKQDGLDDQNRQTLEQALEANLQYVYELLRYGKFEEAKQEYAQLQLSNSDMPQHATALATKVIAFFDNIPELNRLQQAANQALSREDFTRPKRDSALYYYLEMLQIQPEFVVPVAAVSDMLDQLRATADDLYQDGRWGLAYQYARQILVVQPSDPWAKDVTRTIEDYQREVDQIKAWMTQAKQALMQQRYYTPRGDNAYYFLSQVLNKRPDHQKALQLIQQTENNYHNKLSQMQDDGQIEAALADVKQALDSVGRTDFLSGWERELTSRFKSTSNDFVSTPKVELLAVSDRPITDRSRQQKQAIHAGKSLYGMISYSGFRNKNQVIYAVLESMAGQRFEEVPIVITTEFGETRFRIERATRPFETGAYYLKLFYNEQLIAGTEVNIVAL